MENNLKMKADLCCVILSDILCTNVTEIKSIKIDVQKNLYYFTCVINGVINTCEICKEPFDLRVKSKVKDIEFLKKCLALVGDC